MRMTGPRLYRFLIAAVRAINLAKSSPDLVSWEGEYLGTKVILELKED